MIDPDLVTSSRAIARIERKALGLSVLIVAWLFIRGGLAVLGA